MARTHYRFYRDSSLRLVLLAAAIIAGLLIAIFVMRQQVASKGRASVPQAQERNAPLNVAPTP